MFWQGSLLWSRVAGICMAARGMVFACKGEPAPIAPSKPEPKPSDPNHEHEDLETMSMLSMMRDNGNGWVVVFHISFHSAIAPFRSLALMSTLRHTSTQKVCLCAKPLCSGANPGVINNYYVSIKYTIDKTVSRRWDWIAPSLAG